MQTILRENEALRDQSRVFSDRTHAGRVLADMVRSVWLRKSGAMVLTIPSGGVPVGLAMARELHLPLELAIVRKLQIPGNTEAGFGAMTRGGSVFLNRELMQRLGLGEEDVASQKAMVQQELEQRNRLFRQGREEPALQHKELLVADDGLASGYSMLAAVAMARERGASRVVLALPTAPLRSLRMLEGEVDEVFCANLHTSSGPFAVANAYRRWRDLEADEVLRMLEEWEEERDG